MFLLEDAFAHRVQDEILDIHEVFLRFVLKDFVEVRVKADNDAFCGHMRIYD